MQPAANSPAPQQAEDDGETVEPTDTLPSDNRAQRAWSVGDGREDKEQPLEVLLKAMNDTKGLLLSEVVQLKTFVETEVMSQLRYVTSLLQQGLKGDGSGPSNALVSQPPPGISLPLTSEEELVDVELKLRNCSKTTRSLTGYLSLLGGTEIADTTSRILRALITNELALEYNYCGRKYKGEQRKKKFKSLRLKKVIIDAVRGNPLTSSAKDAAVEDVIKSWLRSARQRVQRSDAKMAKDTLGLRGGSSDNSGSVRSSSNPPSPPKKHRHKKNRSRSRSARREDGPSVSSKGDRGARQQDHASRIYRRGSSSSSPTE